MNKEYKEHDEFWEITFEIPEDKLDKYSKKQDKIAKKIREVFNAYNIKVIPCVIRRSNPYLEVSKDDYSYTLFNTKNREKIIEQSKGDGQG